MCGVTELIVAGVGVAVVGIAADVTGAIVSGVSQKNQMNAQANVAQRNAKLQEQQIIEAEKAKQLDNEKLQKESSALMGAGLNQVGASGVDMGSGSIDTWFQEVDRNMKDDVFFNSRNADQQKWGMKNEALNSRYQASIMKRAGSHALLSGGIAALGTAAKGASDIMLSDNGQKGLSAIAGYVKTGYNKTMGWAS